MIEEHPDCGIETYGVTGASQRAGPLAGVARRRTQASATADPPDEPAAGRVGSNRLPVAPQAGLRLLPPATHTGVLVLRLRAPEKVVPIQDMCVISSKERAEENG